VDLRVLGGEAASFEADIDGTGGGGERARGSFGSGRIFPLDLLLDSTFSFSGIGGGLGCFVMVILRGDRGTILGPFSFDFVRGKGGITKSAGSSTIPELLVVFNCCDVNFEANADLGRGIREGGWMSDDLNELFRWLDVFGSTNPLGLGFGESPYSSRMLQVAEALRRVTLAGDVFSGDCTVIIVVMVVVVVVVVVAIFKEGTFRLCFMIPGEVSRVSTRESALAIACMLFALSTEDWLIGLPNSLPFGDGNAR
jgi:hypothetical protein